MCTILSSCYVAMTLDLNSRHIWNVLGWIWTIINSTAKESFVISVTTALKQLGGERMVDFSIKWLPYNSTL